MIDQGAWIPGTSNVRFQSDAPYSELHRIGGVQSEKTSVDKPTTALYQGLLL